MTARWTSRPQNAPQLALEAPLPVAAFPPRPLPPGRAGEKAFAPGVFVGKAEPFSFSPILLWGDPCARGGKGRGGGRGGDAGKKRDATTFRRVHLGHLLRLFQREWGTG
eukprot:9503928-Pyramimonas_sp.AAC.1